MSLANRRIARPTSSTPMMFANGTDFVTCVATNVGTKPATITVTAKDFDGAAAPGINY
jgi:hypothetical protein